MSPTALFFPHQLLPACSGAAKWEIFNCFYNEVWHNLRKDGSPETPSKNGLQNIMGAVLLAYALIFLHLTCVANLDGLET